MAINALFIGLLYYTHNVFYKRIQQQKQLETTQYIRQALNCENYRTRTIKQRQIFYCSSTHFALKAKSHGYVDYIDYIAVFNLNNQIKKIIILKQQETPGLGSKITQQNWLNSLTNRIYDELWLKKEGGKIDSFSAASITPKLLLRSIRSNLNWVKQHKTEITMQLSK